MREHGSHPRLAGREWQECDRIETGAIREQAITAVGQYGRPWRRVEFALDRPTEDGEATIRLWSNLPDEVGAPGFAKLYRARWQIEGLFGRLKGVLNSEVAGLGHPRAALLGFAIAVLAYNVLALLTLLARSVEQAHGQQEPPPKVSTYHLAVLVRNSYGGMLVAIAKRPLGEISGADRLPEHWQPPHGTDPERLADRLLCLARRIDPRQVATSRHKLKPNPQGLRRWQDRTLARRKCMRHRTRTETILEKGGPQNAVHYGRRTITP